MRKIFYLVVLAALTGCQALYPSLMLRTPRNYHFDQLHDSTTDVNYKIAPNDFVEMRLFSQDGFHLIDLTGLSSGVSSGGASLDYLVEIDGTAKLPVLGSTPLSGLTIREATEMLEKAYSKYYIKPYILLQVSSRRVIIFPGDPGAAKVLPLVNNNTTVFEALALTGGISQGGKARKVKLIRGDPNHPLVYLIDLSTINGLKDGNTILQANDIIYVTPQITPTIALIDKIIPVLSGVTTILLTIILLTDGKL